MIHVFKTSVDTEKRIKTISTSINKISPIISWNFDLDDCDYILRVDSEIDVRSIVVETLNDHGFDCIELL